MNVDNFASVENFASIYEASDSFGEKWEVNEYISIFQYVMRS